MRSYREPQFLDKAFMWNAGGYAFHVPASIDLEDDRLLQSDEGWISLAAILHRAKRGEFAPLAQLPELIRDDAPPAFVASCLWLMGDAAPMALAARLSDFMRPGRPNYTRVKACDAALHTGLVSLAPAMLRTWMTIHPRERGLISRYLSNFLEEELQFVAAYYDFSDDEEYFLHTEKIITQLEQNYDGRSIFRGKPISSMQIFAYMRELLTSEEKVDNIQADFGLLRHRIEAMTGCSFSESYRNEILQPLAAATIIEECVESCALENCEPGVRYFFGHRIPDN